MKEFVEKYIDQLLVVMRRQFDIAPLGLQSMKLSMCIDLAIFLIEQVNKLELDKSQRSEFCDQLLSSLPSLFPSIGGLKVYDVAASKVEAKAIALELLERGAADTAEEVLRSNFGYRTLIETFYNKRAQEHQANYDEAPFVCSEMVVKLLKNLPLDEITLELIQEVNSIMLSAFVETSEFFKPKSSSKVQAHNTAQPVSSTKTLYPGVYRCSVCNRNINLIAEKVVQGDFVCQKCKKT